MRPVTKRISEGVTWPTSANIATLLASLNTTLGDVGSSFALSKISILHYCNFRRCWTRDDLLSCLSGGRYFTCSVLKYSIYISKLYIMYIFISCQTNSICERRRNHKLNSRKVIRKKLKYSEVDISLKMTIVVP